MSLILHYKFDQSDLTIDSSTSNIPLVNNGSVVSAVDATYGNVSSFNATTNSYFTGPSLTQLQGSSPWTVSYWVNRNSKTTFNTQLAFGNSLNSGGGISILFGSAGAHNVNYGAWLSTSPNIAVATWTHVSHTYDGTTLSAYIDGVLNNSVNVNLNVSSQSLTIGRDLVSFTNSNYTFTGFMSDFRVYDDSLASTDILQMFNEGPNPPPVLTVTMYTHIADLEWEDVSGASTYRVTATEDTLDEIELTTTVESHFEIFNLKPDTNYTLKVYTDLDTLTPIHTNLETTLSLNSSNVGSLMTRLGNDLTIINETAVDEIDALINEVLTTGDIVNTNIGETIFVETSDSLVLTDTNESILTPFQTGQGAGQSISVVLPDSSTSVVSYDETTNEIVSDTVNFAIGSTLVLGGLKVTVKEI